MQVQFNFLQQGNSFFNVNSANRSLLKDAAGNGTPGNQKGGDKVTLSPQGKIMSAIENLMKQKESISEKKSSLISKTLENGGDMDAISAQLETYEEQLDNIDEQIAQMTANFAKSLTEKQDEKKSGKSDEGKDKEQIQTEQLSTLANVAEDVKHAERISSVKNKVDGEIRVKKAQIKSGEIQIDTLKSKGVAGINVADMIAHMKEDLSAKGQKASELQGQLQELGALQSDKLIDAVEKLNENSKKTVDRKDDDFKFIAEEGSASQPKAENIAAEPAAGKAANS